MERHDLRVNDDIQVDDTCSAVEVQLETWFDAGRKFGVDLSADDAWLILYARYDPFKDTLAMAYEVSTDEISEMYDYQPTAGEAKLIKGMIADKIQVLYHQTPQEFCRDVDQDDTIQMEGHT